MSAAAPSLTPDALPAVTVPGFRKGVFSLARFSRVVSARGCSSRSTRVSPLRPLIVTGAISLAKNPLSWAFAARCWLRNAKASWSARETWNSSATFSPVSGIESMPYCACMIGFTKRQPIVVSCTSAVRWNASVALPMTKGARDMLSTPPATTRSASPVLMARAAVPTASSPEPQSRLIVVRHPRWAAPPGGRPSGPRCGCPRPPDWRSRRSPRRPHSNPRRRCGPSGRARDARRGRPCARRRAPRHSGRSGCGRSRR